jgi:hypothetical protein
MSPDNMGQPTRLRPYSENEMSKIKNLVWLMIFTAVFGIGVTALALMQP